MMKRINVFNFKSILLVLFNDCYKLFYFWGEGEKEKNIRDNFNLKEIYYIPKN